MNKIPVIFGRNYAPGSLAIQVFTWSRWSHVGIVYGDKVIEARGFHGVVITPIEEFKARYTHWEVAHAPVACSIDKAYERALSQVGKSYDWWAIYGIVLRTGWDKEDAWVCSELYAYASGFVRHDRTARFTPEDVWKISQ